MTDQLLDPADIDVDFVPRFRDQLVLVPVQNEAVLYEEDTGAMHQLDPIATVVCGLFDGKRSLMQLVNELSTAFETDRAMIETDVLSLVRTLGRKGLFVDVRAVDDPVEGDSGAV